MSKGPNGEFRITDWRGAEHPNAAGAPPFQATVPLALRLQGDKDMLNFQVGHEVEIRGPILEDANGESSRGDEGGIDFVPFPYLLEEGNQHAGNDPACAVAQSKGEVF